MWDGKNLPLDGLRKMPFRGIPWPNTTPRPRGNRPVQQEREVCVKRHKRISSGKGGSDLLRGRGERSHKRTLQIGFPWARGEEQGREISQSLEKGAKIIAVSDADQFACIITCCIITKKDQSHFDFSKTGPQLHCHSLLQPFARSFKWQSSWKNTAGHRQCAGMLW